MADKTAATVGFVLAGAMVASATFEWPGGLTDPIGPFESPLAAVLGGIVMAVFLTRRHGAISRPMAAIIAGVGSVALTGYGVTTLLVSSMGGTGVDAVGPLFAAIASVSAATMAYADWRGIDGSTLWQRLRRVGGGLLLAVGGLLAGALVPLIGLGVSFGVVGDLPSVLAFALGIVLFGLGLVLVAVWFLLATDRGLGYIDVRVPNRWDVGFAVGGLVALIGVALMVGTVFSLLNVPTAENSIERTARTDGAEVLLVAIPLAWLAIGLGEEFIFRGVIQTYLDESFGTTNAIVITSAIFALVHIPAYYTPDPLALASVLALIFGLSLILGWTYARTRNLLVPIFIHGTYNAIVFLAIYVTLTGQVPGM